jgi:hypothetical protein
MAKTVTRKLKQGRPLQLPPHFLFILLPSRFLLLLLVRLLTALLLSPTRSCLQPSQPCNVVSQPATPPKPARFPIDPATDFQSPHPRRFPRFMFCGDPNHVFRQCPGNGDPGADTAFVKNYSPTSSICKNVPHLPAKCFLPLLQVFQ